MIIFRADVSPLTGLQHVRRCAYLVSLLKKSSRVMLCVREDKWAAKFLAGRNIPFAFVKDPGAMDMVEVTAVIFDLPHFSASDSALLENTAKAGIKSIQIVPDGRAAPAADFVVSGPALALLHHKFRHFSQVKRKHRKNIKSIFINLGDLLPYRDLRKVIDSLHRLRFNMKIAPGLNLKKADKRNLMKIYPGIHFCGKSESPARAYFEADLALIPAGEEALEAACVGTPALFMTFGEELEALADSRAGKGTGVKSPSLDDFSVETVRDVIAPLTLELREQMGIAGKALVDGLGVQRFFKILKDNGIIE